VQEVRQWIGQTKLNQAAAFIAPKRTNYINNLAEEMFKQIQTYDTKLSKGTIVGCVLFALIREEVVLCWP
jgi:hypothetical protein